LLQDLPNIASVPTEMTAGVKGQHPQPNISVAARRILDKEREKMIVHYRAMKERRSTQKSTK
jgi:hypothetical protein